MENNSPVQVLLLEQAQASPSNFERYCRSNGWHVEIASLDPTAFDLIKVKDFDVVIADCAMPSVSCVDLVRQIHSTSPGQAVIVVTQNGSLQEALNVLRQGDCDYLQLPVDTDALRVSVKRLLSDQQLEEKRIEQLAFQSEYNAKFEYYTKDYLECPAQVTVVDDLFKAGYIDEETKLGIYLAFQEAITNSLEHGNLELVSSWKEQFDADGNDLYALTKKSRLQDDNYAKRKIYWEVSYQPGELKFIFEDQGKGFLEKEHKSYAPEQPQSDNMLNCYGRGLPLIRGLMDFIEYRNHGRILEIRKTLKKI